jgi:hypothetical protein
VTRLSLVVLSTVWAGCAGDTSLLLDLELAPGFAQPATLQVTMYAQGVVGAPQSVPLASAGRALPGKLIVRPLDAALPDPRVLVNGLDAQGKLFAQAAAHVALSAGHQTTVTLTLGAPLPDTDGDGVPDVIDDCPTIPDPDQRCVAPGSDAAVDQAIPPDGDGATPTDLLKALACPAGAIFCDDFETGDTSKWNSVNVAGGGSLNVDNVHPWAGSYSLDVTGTAGSNGHAELGKNLTPLGLSTLSLRAYVSSASVPASYTLFLALFNGTKGWAVGGDGSGNWVVTQDSGTLADLTTNVPVPVNQWVCVELITNPPSAMFLAGRVRLFTDGNLILDATPGDFTAPTELDVGLVRSPAGQTPHVYVDDVALANAPIGCE